MIEWLKLLFSKKESVSLIVDNEGNRFWYDNTGQLHRTDSPAIELADGSKFWYQHDRRHRTDGPAREYANGNREYYINGQKLTFEEWTLHSFVLHKQKHEPNNR